MPIDRHLGDRCLGVSQFHCVTIFRLAGQLIMRLRVDEMQACTCHFLTLNWLQVPRKGAILALDSLFVALFNLHFLNSSEFVLSNLKIMSICRR